MIRGIWSAFVRWVRAPETPPPPSRLTREQAVAIARGAVPPGQDPERLVMPHCWQRDGRLIWTVSEAAIGSVLNVDVDDATGEVLAVRRVGLR